MLQLRNTVHRTNKDEHNSRAERILEPSELLRIPQLEKTYILSALTRFVQAVNEFQSQSHEDEQRNDLEHKTSDHDCPPYLALGGIINCCSEPTTGTLENKRDKVACYEGDCVGARTEPGDLLAVYDNYTGEAEVEGAGEKSRGDC